MIEAPRQPRGSRGSTYLCLRGLGSVPSSFVAPRFANRRSMPPPQIRRCCSRMGSRSLISLTAQPRNRPPLSAQAQLGALARLGRSRSAFRGPRHAGQPLEDVTRLCACAGDGSPRVCRTRCWCIGCARRVAPHRSCSSRSAGTRSIAASCLETRDGRPRSPSSSARRCSQVGGTL